jgi:phosphodiesterase/alkaline phosphatase D-like protein
MGVLNDALIRAAKENKIFPSVILVTGLAVLTFFLMASSALALEAPVTREAKHVAGSSAELRGELNPRSSGSEDHYDFYYNAGSSCEGGQISTEEGPVSGEKLAVDSVVSGLEGKSEYTFCVVELHEGEVERGGELHFQTLADAPVVEGESSSSIGPFAATLEATVNPENEEASCEFEYGTSSALVGASKVACSEALPANRGGEGAKASITGLIPSTAHSPMHYYYRVVVKNAGGTSRGAIEEFTTAIAQAPTIEAERMSGLGLGMLLLEAKINPQGQSTTCVFEYGTSPTLTGAVVVECDPGSIGPDGEAEVEALVSGLTSGDTYYYRVNATNATGATAGEIKSFSVGVPVVEAESSSEVMPTQARLDATINPEYEETSCVFEYSYTSSTLASGVTSASCDPVSLGTDAGGVSVSDVLTGLKSGTSYYYRVHASNETTTVHGAIESFATPALLVPVVEGEGVPAISPYEAVLEASVNPGWQQTECKFEYGPEAKLEHEVTITACSAPLAASGSGEPTTITATGLKPAITYYYRVKAKNATATTTGTIESFATSALVKPEIESEEASMLTPTSALLEAQQITPNWQVTKYAFEYATEESLIEKREGTRTPDETTAAGTLAEPPSNTMSLEVTGLRPGTTYYFRVIASNPAGEEAAANPVIASFTTTDTPAATTGAAEVLSPSTANVSGTVTPDGLATTYRIQYGGTKDYGDETPVTEAGSGDSAVPISVKLEGLEPGITYHYRLVAINDGGTQKTFGEDATFTTQSTPAALTGVGHSGETASGATIAGTVEARGIPTRWEVLLAPASPGGAAPAAEDFRLIASGVTSANYTITESLGNLVASTTYYYKFVAENQDPPAAEATGTFATQPPPTGTTSNGSSVIVFPANETTIPNISTTTRTTTTTKPLTKQRLAKILKACKREKSKSKRARCEKRAKANAAAKGRHR